MEPDPSFTFHKSQEAIKLEIDGVLYRKAFSFIPLNKMDKMQTYQVAASY